MLRSLVALQRLHAHKLAIVENAKYRNDHIWMLKPMCGFVVSFRDVSSREFPIRVYKYLQGSGLRLK